MKYLSAAVFLLAAIAPTVQAQEENPFKKANIGDWAEYKLDTTVQNIKLTGTMKLVVTAKTEKEATLKTVVRINDQEVSAQETKIDLTKPFDPTSTTGLPNAAEAKVEKSAEPKQEKIKVAGKDMECTMTSVKLSAKVMGQDFDSNVKVWTNKDIPLSGLAKMELKSKLADMEIIYLTSGAKQ